MGEARRPINSVPQWPLASLLLELLDWSLVPGRHTPLVTIGEGP